MSDLIFVDCPRPECTYEKAFMVVDHESHLVERSAGDDLCDCELTDEQWEKIQASAQEEADIIDEDSEDDDDGDETE